MTIPDGFSSDSLFDEPLPCWGPADVSKSFGVRLQWTKWHYKMHVELIVPLPGLYNDQIMFFFPAGGLPQGHILPFSSIYSSLIWNDVPICSMCAWVSAAVHLNLTNTHTLANLHTWKWFQGLRGMWPSWHPSSDTEKQPHPPHPQPHVHPQPTTAVSSFWGP